MNATSFVIPVPVSLTENERAGVGVSSGVDRSAMALMLGGVFPAYSKAPMSQRAATYTCGRLTPR